MDLPCLKDLNTSANNPGEWVVTETSGSWITEPPFADPESEAGDSFEKDELIGAGSSITGPEPSSTTRTSVVTYTVSISDVVLTGIGSGADPWVVTDNIDSVTESTISENGTSSKTWGVDNETYYSQVSDYAYDHYSKETLAGERVWNSYFGWTYFELINGPEPTSEITDNPIWSNYKNYLRDKGTKLLIPITIPDDHEEMAFYPWMEEGKNNKENSSYVFASSFKDDPLTKRAYAFYNEELQGELAEKAVEAIEFDVDEYGTHKLSATNDKDAEVEETCDGRVGAAQREEFYVFTWTEEIIEEPITVERR